MSILVMYSKGITKFTLRLVLWGLLAIVLVLSVFLGWISVSIFFSILSALVALYLCQVLCDAKKNRRT